MFAYYVGYTLGMMQTLRHKNGVGHPYALNCGASLRSGTPTQYKNVPRHRREHIALYIEFGGTFYRLFLFY